MNESIKQWINQSRTRIEGLPTEKQNLSNNSSLPSSTIIREKIKILEFQSWKVLGLEARGSLPHFSTND